MHTEPLQHLQELSAVTWSIQSRALGRTLHGIRFDCAGSNRPTLQEAPEAIFRPRVLQVLDPPALAIMDCCAAHRVIVISRAQTCAIQGREARAARVLQDLPKLAQATVLLI